MTDFPQVIWHWQHYKIQFTTGEGEKKDSVENCDFFSASS